MLAKVNRLVKDRDFKNVFRNGRVVKEKFLLCRYVENDLNIIRFGFIVSKKISNKATVRHKITRQLREIIKTKLNSMDRGYDIIISAMTGIQNATYGEIEQCITKLLSKAGILGKLIF